MIPLALFAGSTKPDIVVFSLCAVICTVGAIGVVINKNPIHSALSLVMTLFGVAVLFVCQEAHFLAAVQVIVYAGAVVILFLFVIMLIGVDKSERLGIEKNWYKTALAIAIPIAVLGCIIFLGRADWVTGTSLSAPGTDENVKLLARSIFGDYLLPFELTSILLVIAVIGAVVLARRSDYVVIDLSDENSDEAESEDVPEEVQ